MNALIGEFTGDAGDDDADEDCTQKQYLADNI
jgi:hypothetical protein